MAEFAVQAAQILAPTASLVNSGVYICSSHIAVPLLYGLPTSISTAAFSSLYHRGTLVVAPLCALSALSSAALAYAFPARRALYAVAGIAAFAPLPWTRLFMMGTINRALVLKENEVEREKVGPGHVDELLRTWQWMNYVRAAMTLVGGVVGVWGLMDIGIGSL